MKKIIFVAVATLFFAACAGRAGKVSVNDVADDLLGGNQSKVDCTAVKAVLNDALAFAPTEYCAGLAEYLKFKDDYNAFVTNGKSACSDLAKLQVAIGDIDIDLVLAKLVDDKVKEIPSVLDNTVVNLAQISKQQKIATALYAMLVPSAYAGGLADFSGTVQQQSSAQLGGLSEKVNGGSIVVPADPCLLAIAGTFQCQPIKAVLYQPFKCASAGIDAADAETHFVKAFATYLHNSAISAKTVDVLEPVIQAAIDATPDKRIMDIK
ncbi:MAG: hypothetical protein WCQ53_01475 [bacterium]